MSNSEHPLYKLGFQRGRKRTEREVADLRRQQDHAERWNAIFVSLLPVAMQVQGWKIDEETVHNAEQRVELARLWADRAVKSLKW